MGIGNSLSLVAEELAAGMSGVAGITSPLGKGATRPPNEGAGHSGGRPEPSSARRRCSVASTPNTAMALESHRDCCQTSCPASLHGLGGGGSTRFIGCHVRTGRVVQVLCHPPVVAGQESPCRAERRLESADGRGQCASQRPVRSWHDRKHGRVGGQCCLELSSNLPMPSSESDQIFRHHVQRRHSVDVIASCTHVRAPIFFR